MHSGTAQSCGDCERCLCADILGFSASYRRIAHRPFRFTSKVYCQTHLPFHLPCLDTRENTDGRLPGKTRSGPHLQSITRGTVTLGEVSEALAATPLNTRKDSISGTRGGPVTLPEATKLTWRLRSKFLQESSLRRYERCCGSSAGVRSERLRACGRDKR